MKSRKGFTLIEVAVVVMIGAILTSFTVNAFGRVRTRLAVREARQTLAAFHARARAQAIEFGTSTILNLSTAGDSIWISRNDTTLEMVRFGDELGVDLQGTQTLFQLCMNPRGYGKESCNNFTSTATLYLVNATDTAEVKMYPLGQLSY